MIQTALLPNCTAEDRWQPVVPPFRPRLLVRITSRKPVPGQLSLPGMGLTDDSGEIFLPSQEAAAAACGKAADAAARPPPTCPNCGGREFDEDGDCTRCREPGVVRPVARKRKR